MADIIDFRTRPEAYRHWRLEVDGRVAVLHLDVAEDGGLFPGYELKLNSYDLGVDIELRDAIERLRFEHPEVGAVVLTSDRERMFCAGANIRMLGQSTHAAKVNFCKFTNETRNSIEDASASSGQRYLCAVNGTAAGGGYELALATDYIMLVDDGSSAVGLPEVPLLAVLPGTGGLTRLVDKRKVRRDRADYFCTLEEGIRGRRALEWGLVDELVPSSRFWSTVMERARESAERSDRPADASGVALHPIERTIEGDEIRYRNVRARIDRRLRAAEITVLGPDGAPPESVEALQELGDGAWPLALARELDDLVLHLRHNELDVGTWVLRTEGDGGQVKAYDDWMEANGGHWLVREIRLLWKRVLKRLDVTARSLIALVEPGSCFAGTLLELALAADRGYMLDGTFEGDERPAPAVLLTSANFGPYPTVNGLTRLAIRHWGTPAMLDELAGRLGEPMEAPEAEAAGLVTFTPDDIDWEDEVRLALEERAAFSPDALTGMEANLRFPGPETMESKIFARLSAWQNWIFQRPNAVGEQGALRLYGTGRRSEFSRERV